MKTSRFASLFAVACIAAAAFSSAVVHVAHQVVRVVRYGLTLLRGFFLAPTPKSTTETKPSVVLVAARAFVLKQMQRTRPLFTARWRMCPSA